MTIQTRDQLIDALANNSQTLTINKATISNQAAGGFCSLWRATGTPGQAAIPGAAALCTSALLGAMNFNNPTPPARSYIGRLFLVSGNSATDIQIHDRLAHRGGLAGNSTGVQTVGIDLNTSSDNIPNRRGQSDYSEVQWWLEIYTDIGTTATTCTITYTDANGTGSKTTTLSIGGASPANRAGRAFLIQPTDGIPIRSIESAQLTATTGTAGSWGITASRALGGLSLGLANSGIVADWAQTGLSRVHDDACLYPVVICGTTSSGTLYGNLKLIQG